MAKIVQRVYLYTLSIFSQKYHVKKWHCQDQEFGTFKTINQTKNFIQNLPVKGRILLANFSCVVT